MKFLVEASKAGTVLPRVMRAAVRLFVARGIHGTTTKDIARAARVSEGALYRHFASKEALAYHIFAVQVNAFTQELSARVAEASSTQKKIHVYISTCFEAYEQETDLFTYLIISEHRELERFPGTFKHPGHVALDLVAEGQKKGDFRPLDIGLGASLLVGSVIRACIARRWGTIPGDLGRQALPLAETLWRGFKK